MSDDQLLQTIELRDKLDKIRSQIHSKLANQQQLALILQTVDENLDSHSQEKSAVAYFVSFLSLLDQCCENDEIKDLTLASGAVYFLNLVSPYTSKALLRPRFADILIKIAPTLTDEKAQAPLLRSSIGFLGSLLLAQDFSSWSNVHNYKISPKRGLMALLELSLDSRPKVRKAAQEAVHNVLSENGSSSEHPGSGAAAEFALKHLIPLIEKGQSSKETNSQVIHNLQLISSMTEANAWPVSQVDTLCDVLLEICKSADQYMVGVAFSVFERLLQSITNDARFVKVLDVIFSLKPAVNDSQLAPSWLAVVAKAVTCYAQNIDSGKCLAKIPDVFTIVGEYFGSEVENVYISASQCLIAIVTDAVDTKLLLLPPAVEPKVYEQVDEVIGQLAKLSSEFLTVKYRHCAKEVSELIGAMFLSFRTRANPDFLDHLEVIGGWRSNEQQGFELNDVAERVISVAIASVGPDAVLGVLPLNLTNPKAVGRAWLLPLLRDSVRCAELGYYTKEILPSTAYFEDLISKTSNESMNAKVFATIVDQIWSLLPAFCDLPSDLQTGFSDEFAARLSEILYKDVGKRPTICHSLRMLVESNTEYATGSIVEPLINQSYPPEKSKQALEYLTTTKAANLLSVLFNVFSETPMDQRNYVLQTIDAYLGICKPDDLVSIFNKVCTLLKNALDEEAKENNMSKTEDPSDSQKISKLSVTMMDLIIEITKHLPASSHNALFAIFGQTVKVPDVQIQKRAYRIFSNLMETEAGLQSVLGIYGQVLPLLAECSETTLAAAKPARFQALLLVVKNLSADYLHFVPTILSEVILGTKSVNESARNASYDILVEIGKKFDEFDGSPIRNSLNDESMPDSQASVKELFVMCSAGLAGGSPHMVSATVTAISRIMFEFQGKLPIDFVKEIALTIDLFLTSKNREIIKSALGFVKVTTLTLPEDEVKPELKGILSTLMTINREQKSHFRDKIKHLIERLVRKFGFQYIEECLPEDDRRLIANMRKSKARAQRKKAEGLAAPDAAGQKKFTSAYEEALYGETDSESDEEGKDEDEDFDMDGHHAKQYISESKDAPLDLLDKDALAHISSSRPRKFTKKDAKYHTKNGKLVFIENGEEDELDHKNSVDAYVEAIKQGPIKGQGGRFKYTKAQRKDDEIDWDDGSDDESEKKQSQKQQKRRKVKGGRIAKRQPKFKSRKKF